MPNSFELVQGTTVVLDTMGPRFADYTGGISSEKGYKRLPTELKSRSKHQTTMMQFSRTAISAILLFMASTAIGQCPTGKPLDLCCRAVGPYSGNSVIWERVCGFGGVNDTSVLVAGGCSRMTW